MAPWRNQLPSASLCCWSRDPSHFPSVSNFPGQALSSVCLWENGIAFLCFTKAVELLSLVERDWGHLAVIQDVQQPGPKSRYGPEDDPAGICCGKGDLFPIQFRQGLRAGWDCSA